MYSIYGYKGKQVRDNIHNYDIAWLMIQAIYHNPRCGAVYNLGGGRGNFCSILEAFDIFRQMTDKKMNTEYQDSNREGDHICYITNLRRVQDDYPGWTITKPLEEIFVEITASRKSRRDSA